MKRKLFAAMTALLLTVTASAQRSDIGPFDQGKLFIGGSLTGLNLSYNGLNDLSLGVSAQAGYTIADNLMLLGQASFQHYGSDTMADEFKVGVGGRYYIIQNGLYLGANCNLVHAEHSYNDIRPGVEVGYAFFLSRTVTVEPAIYYDQSFKKHSDYSTIGLKVGIGVYLFKD